MAAMRVVGDGRRLPAHANVREEPEEVRGLTPGGNA
jgi:hypothetical protein